MKYFSDAQIDESLSYLMPHSPFFGITFLVMKKRKAPIGSKIRFKLDAENTRFLDQHYRVHPKSQYFFRVFRPNKKRQDWVKPDYASKSLQAINTQTFRDAFLHEKNDNTWGWAPDYVEQLTERLLRRSIRIPLYHLAVWIYREQSFDDSLNRANIVDLFVNDFSLTEHELSSLFQVGIDSELSEDSSFQQLPVRWHEILASRSRPNDVPAESSGTLNYLEVESVGPVSPLIFRPAPRLNLITGDNGLGKTFLLDLSWWALTRDWPGRMATPLPEALPQPPKIKFSIGDSLSGAQNAVYDARLASWVVSDPTQDRSGLAIYAMLDGSFAVWDPAFGNLADTFDLGRKPSLLFTRDEIWDGKSRQLEGLIRDWVKWQQSPDRYPAYSTFEAVLSRVFPPDMGPLKIGKPVRIRNDSRDIPTLIHPYGSVPILFESAGIQRIVTLAYLLVWAWEEHKLLASQQAVPEERQMIVLIDEAESHLHPKWQRVLLPALFDIGTELHNEMAIQWIIASHSPLVMASGEAIWDASSDILFHLDLNADGRVSFSSTPFERRGSVDSWLSSTLFEIPLPGSREREFAIQSAIDLQQQQDVSSDAVRIASDLLKEHLAPEDPFWVRWILFAENHGVPI